MGSGFAKKKKEARLFQESLQEMQEKLKNSSSTGTSGGGLVSITLNGNHEITDLKIKPECVDPEDVDGLVDLIRVAYKDATSKLKSNKPELPGGFSLGNFGL